MPYAFILHNIAFEPKSESQQKKFADQSRVFDRRLLFTTIPVLIVSPIILVFSEIVDFGTIEMLPSEMECDRNVGEVEREEANVCGGYSEERTMDINGVFIPVNDPSK
ncbi:hypothetical protein CRYUN_Cryun10bG0047800 [Craigia yunnanensis]